MAVSRAGFMLALTRPVIHRLVYFAKLASCQLSCLAPKFPGETFTYPRFYGQFSPWNTATVKLDELSALCKPGRLKNTF